MTGSKHTFMVFLSLSFIMSDAAIAGWEAPGSTWNISADSLHMRRILLSGFDDPDLFFRSNACSETVDLLATRSDLTCTVFPYDSLVERMKNARVQHAFSLTALCGIACFAGNRQAECSPLLEAGNIIAWMLQKQELGLSIFRLAQAAGCASAADSMLRVRKYIENDRGIASLLSAEMPEGKELRTYARTCEQALARHPETSLRKEMYVRLGASYSSLKKYSRMKKWYLKAVAIDQSLYDLTLIKYELEKYARLRMKQGGLAAATILGCCVFFLLLFLGTVKRDAFDFRYFCGKFAVFIVLFGFCSAAVFYIDIQQARHLFRGPGSAETIALGLTDPVVPMSMMDSSFMKYGVWFLLYGLAPLLVSVYCSSFKNVCPRWLSVLATLASILAIWTALYFYRIEDQVQSRQMYITSSRLYINDELEVILPRYPEKVLRANPGILKSNNEDLKAFLNKYFPDGIDKKPR